MVFDILLVFGFFFGCIFVVAAAVSLGELLMKKFSIFRKGLDSIIDGKDGLYVRKR